MASKIIRSGFKSQIKQTFATRDKKAMSYVSNGILSTINLMKKANRKEIQIEIPQSSSTGRFERKGPRCNLNAVSSVMPSPIPDMSNPKASASTPSLVGRFFDSIETNDNDEVQSKQSAVAALAISRRIFRTSAYHQFQRRRYSSSTSRSGCNIFQRYDDRRRVTKAKRVKDAFVDRPLSTGTTDRSILGMVSAKYLEPLRNQNMSSTLGSISQAAKVSSMIQEDLMPIDKSMRERISVKNPQSLRVDEQKDIEPMASWYHPPSPEILSNRIMERLAERRQVPTIKEKTVAAEPARPVNPAYRKRRLDQQCKEPSEIPSQSSKASSAIAAKNSSSSPPISKKKATESLSQSQSQPQTSHSQSLSRTELQLRAQPPVAACDTANINENVSSSLTARRVNNVHQEPVRRFSLRRPPKNNVPEIATPAPGPAAESLNQIKSTYSMNPYNVGRAAQSSEFNLKRYSGGPGSWF